MSSISRPKRLHYSSANSKNPACFQPSNGLKTEASLLWLNYPVVLKGKWTLCMTLEYCGWNSDIFNRLLTSSKYMTHTLLSNILITYNGRAFGVLNVLYLALYFGLDDVVICKECKFDFHCFGRLSRIYSCGWQAGRCKMWNGGKDNRRQWGDVYLFPFQHKHCVFWGCTTMLWMSTFTLTLAHSMHLNKSPGKRFCWLSAVLDTFVARCLSASFLPSLSSTYFSSTYFVSADFPSLWLWQPAWFYSLMSDTWSYSR